MKFFNIKTLIKLAMTPASFPQEHWSFDFAYKYLFNVEKYGKHKLNISMETQIKKLRQENVQFTDLLIDYI